MNNNELQAFNVLIEDLGMSKEEILETFEKLDEKRKKEIRDRANVKLQGYAYVLGDKAYRGEPMTDEFKHIAGKANVIKAFLLELN